MCASRGWRAQLKLFWSTGSDASSFCAARDSDRRSDELEAGSTLHDMSRGAAVAVLGLVALLAGCATAVPSPPPASPPPSATDFFSDLRGTWTGTWGGTPLNVVITAQADGGDPAGGVYLGTFLVFGERAPTVSGVMTYTRQGEAVSVSVRGWTRASGRAVTLVLAAAAPD